MFEKNYPRKEGELLKKLNQPNRRTVFDPPAALQKHYRRKDVERITGLSRSSLYDMMKQGKFPRPVRIGRRAVAWSETSLAEWLATRETAAA